MQENFPARDDTYTHAIPNCTTGGGSEINCVEWVQFLENNRANVLIGGSDILLRRKYSLNENEITVYDESGLSSLSDLIFGRISADTLLRIVDNTFWVLESNP